MLKEIAGEISGIYEVSVKRGHLGYLCAALLEQYGAYKLQMVYPGMGCYKRKRGV